MIISYFRTIVLYLVLIAGIRLLGKRQIGQMEASEFVVTMLVANLASIPMQDSGIPLLSGVVPILTVIALELALSWLTMRSVVLRRLLCGKPVILIENGRLLPENLRSTRVSLDELTGHLRQKDVMDIQSVQYAILETDGNISVFPYPSSRPATAADAGIKVKEQYLPVSIIVDGYLSRKDLARAGKNEQWLQKTLGSHGAKVEDTMLLTVDRAGNVVFLRKESK